MQRCQNCLKKIREGRVLYVGPYRLCRRCFLSLAPFWAARPLIATAILVAGVSLAVAFAYRLR